MSCCGGITIEEFNKRMFYRKIKKLWNNHYFLSIKKVLT